MTAPLHSHDDCHSEGLWVFHHLFCFFGCFHLLRYQRKDCHHNFVQELVLYLLFTFIHHSHQNLSWSWFYQYLNQNHPFLLHFRLHLLLTILILYYCCIITTATDLAQHQQNQNLNISLIIFFFFYYYLLLASEVQIRFYISDLLANYRHLHHCRNYHVIIIKPYSHSYLKGRIHH